MSVLIRLLALASAVVAPPLTAYLDGAPPIAASRQPPPPLAGSVAAKADTLSYAASRAGIGGPGWQAAQSQLYLSKPAGMAGQIACAVGAPVNPGNAPILFQMLSKIVASAVPSIDAVKAHYHRARPFVGDTEFKVCDPRVKADETGNYSYPSGHAVIGVIWGEALAATTPARALAAREWGRQIGDNRIACRVHWRSDVAYGQIIGARLYRQIALNPAYRADLAMARREIDAARAAQAVPMAKCG
jgi:acid phosphatase (class A)